MHLGFYAPPQLNPTAVDGAHLGKPIPPPIRGGGEEADKPPHLAGYLIHARFDEDHVEAYRRHMAAMVTGIDLPLMTWSPASNAQGSRHPNRDQQ